MAPLSPDNTPRYVAHYTTTGGPQHSLLVRAPAPVSPGAFGIWLNALFLALGSDLWQTTLNSVDFIPAGSNIANPVTTGFEGAVYGTGTTSSASIPLALSFVGRTSGGRRGRIFIYGFKIGDSNYRFQLAENANIAAAHAVIVGASGYPLGIDGLELVWKAYANMGWNDHWIRELRG